MDHNGPSKPFGTNYYNETLLPYGNVLKVIDRSYCEANDYTVAINSLSVLLILLYFDFSHRLH